MAVMRALEYGPGNPRQIAERLSDYVRKALNVLADDGTIDRNGFPGRGNEKIYSLKPLPRIKRRV
jgi:hypothetical protein